MPCVGEQIFFLVVLALRSYMTLLQNIHNDVQRHAISIFDLVQNSIKIQRRILGLLVVLFVYWRLLIRVNMTFCIIFDTLLRDFRVISLARCYQTTTVQYSSINFIVQTIDDIMTNSS